MLHRHDAVIEKLLPHARRHAPGHPQIHADQFFLVPEQTLQAIEQRFRFLDPDRIVDRIRKEQGAAHWTAPAPCVLGW